MLDAEFLAVLACPCCKGSLKAISQGGSAGGNTSHKAEGLLCENCALVFPSEGSIQILLKEEAIPMQEWQSGRYKNRA